MNGLQIVWAMLLLLMGPLNAVAIRQLSATRKISRWQAYSSTARALLGVGLMTLIVDFAGAQRGIGLMKHLAPAQTVVAWTIVVFATCVVLSFATLFLRRHLHEPYTGLTASLFPETIQERSAIFALSFLAGASEEYMLRGFCFGFLASVSGTVLWPAVVVTLSFGIAHGYQDRIGMLRATLLGVALIVPVIMTGMLLPSIIAHIGMDVIAGLPSYKRVLVRLSAIKSRA